MGWKAKLAASLRPTLGYTPHISHRGHVGSHHMSYRGRSINFISPAECNPKDAGLAMTIAGLIVGLALLVFGAITGNPLSVGLGFALSCAAGMTFKCVFYPNTMSSPETSKNGHEVPKEQPETVAKTTERPAPSAPDALPDEA